MIEDFDKDLFKKCMPFFSEKPIILDIGAHKGSYTDFVLGMIPEADCYLFEPNIELYNALKDVYKNVSPFAVCEGTGIKIFNVCPRKNDELSSLYKRKIFDETGSDSVSVKCTSIDDLSVPNNFDQIDFIKIDVEGAEKDVITGASGMMNTKRIKFIQFEYGSTYIDADIQFVDILKIASWHDYKCYEIIKDRLSEVTEQNFVNDYRYSVFLLTYMDMKC